MQQVVHKVAKQFVQLLAYSDCSACVLLLCLARRSQSPVWQPVAMAAG
jgi:hypothetical protein